MPKIRMKMTSGLIRATEIVTDLEAVRALADPLRLRILGALIDEPRTTKQVADFLGEKHTKLYHHVETLERAGIIRLISTRPKRGTVERFYQAVAAKFEVADSALRPVTTKKELAANPKEVIANALIEKARADLISSLNRVKGDSAPAKDEGPIAAHYVIKGSPQRMRAIRRRLLAMMSKLTDAKKAEITLKNEEQTCTLTLFFCRTE